MGPPCSSQGTPNSLMQPDRQIDKYYISCNQIHSMRTQPQILEWLREPQSPDGRMVDSALIWPQQESQITLKNAPDHHRELVSVLCQLLGLWVNHRRAGGLPSRASTLWFNRRQSVMQKPVGARPDEQLVAWVAAMCLCNITRHFMDKWE